MGAEGALPIRSEEAVQSEEIEHDAISAGVGEPFRLGEWLVEPRRLRLSHRGNDGEERDATVQPKAMAVLEQLAGLPGQVLTKAELLDTVWSGQFVVEGVLKNVISDLRRILGDEPKKPTFIETIPRRGYRLIAPVERELEALPNTPISTDATSVVRWRNGSPYRGLQRFEFDQAEVFFGREKAVAEMMGALGTQSAAGRAFLLVLGMSGGGKSSAVLAGLVPELVRPGAVEGVMNWRRAVLRPSDHPENLFEALVDALAQTSALPSLRGDDTGRSELAILFRASPEAGLERVARELLELEPELGAARVVLVVDQLEEIFTLPGMTEQIRRDFFELIYHFARSGLVWVIATLRSDFYPKITAFETVRALKAGAGQYDLLPPTPAEIGRMVRLPAEAAGICFEEDSETGERLQDLLRDAASADPGALPLLQFTLEELYKRRREDGTLLHAAYRELGGVEGCLVQRAESVSSRLDDSVQAALPQVLELLVSVDRDHGQTIGARPALWSQVAASPESEELVAAFVDARLLIAELNPEGQRVVRVGHEALLRRWPRVRDWLESNREKLRSYDRLCRAARRWDEEARSHDFLLPRGKPLLEARELLTTGAALDSLEREFLQASESRAGRRQRIDRALRLSLLGLAVTALVAAIWANYERNQADTERQATETLRQQEATQRETAEETAQFLMNIFELSDPGESLGESITAREILERAAERIEVELTEQPSTQANLMGTIGQVYGSLGLYDDSEQLLTAALERKRELLPADHPEIVLALNRLASLLLDRGESDRAGGLADEALEMSRRLPSPSQRAIVDSLNISGTSLYFAGATEKAEALYQEAASRGHDLRGDERIELAYALSNLGAIRQRQGKFDEAVESYREALPLVEELLGAQHPQLAVVSGNFGACLRKLGKLPEAEVHYRRALAINRGVLDPFHPQVAQSLNNLAILLRDQGHLAEAETALRDAIAIMDRNGGSRRLQHVLYLGNLAYVLRLGGRFDEALAFAEQAVDGARTAVPSGSWRQAFLESVLGDCLSNGGQLDRAEPLLVRSHTALAEALGGEAQEARLALNRVVEHLQRAGRDEAAVAYRERYAVEGAVDAASAQ